MSLIGVTPSTKQVLVRVVEQNFQIFLTFKGTTKMLNQLALYFICLHSGYVEEIMFGLSTKNGPKDSYTKVLISSP